MISCYDFYPCSYVPVGKSDLEFLDTTYVSELGIPKNGRQWMIAIDGHQCSETSNQYQWETMIFILDSKKNYEYDRPPFYSTGSVLTMKEAIDLAREWKEILLHDLGHKDLFITRSNVAQ